jgi:aminocarboxymuconate-semialdehyde decarboxylase
LSDPTLIDIHTHILPEHIPDFGSRFGYGEFITLEVQGATATMLKGGSFFRTVDRRLFDPEVRLEHCHRFGIAVQVLSTVPVMFSYWTKPEDGAAVSAFLNDDLAATVAAGAGRFVGLGTLPMQATDLAIAELERCIRDLGLAGAEIGTNIEQMNLSNPRFFPIFEAAEDLGAALFVHPWEMMGESVMADYWLPWLVGMPAETSRAICSMIFGGVFERLPRLRVAFAHGGGSFPATFGRIQHGYEALPEYVGVDNPHPPSEYIGRFWLDSMVHSPEVLRVVVDLVGPNRVCLGTDFPFRLGEEEPGSVIRASGFSKATEAQLLTHNAAAWLGESGFEHG